MDTLRMIEVCSEEETRKIAHFDATHFTVEGEKLTTNPALYVEVNSLAYYVCVNTWLLLVRDLDPYVWISLKERIVNKGLLATIGVMVRASEQVVSDEYVDDPIARAIVRIASQCTAHDWVASDPDYNFTRDARAAALVMLRYPKRFSPNANEGIKAVSMRDFIATENATKLRQRREYNPTIISNLRDIIEAFLPWDKVCDEIDQLTDLDIVLPPGSAFNASSYLGSKLQALADERPECFVNPFGIPYLGAYAKYDANSVDGIEGEARAVQVLAVPKSYKASRIIAMEDVYRQSMAGAISSILRKHTLPNLDVSDQERNQIYAWKGSRWGTYATLDASHASDMISKSLCRSIFPARFMEQIERFIGTHTIVDGKVRTMQMFSTSGNSLTFDIETMVYGAVACLSAHWFQDFASSDVKDWVHSDLYSAYGDDTIVPFYAADTAVHIFQAIGLKINETKSYWSGPYRESCGKEYYQGIDVTSLLFPRFPIVGTLKKGKVQLGVRLHRDTYRGKIDDSTTMLISLQHKLFGLSTAAATFVAYLVRKARPQITTSVYTDGLSDLWGFDDLGKPEEPRGYALVETDKGPTFKRVPVSPGVEAWYEEHRPKRHTFPSIKYRETTAITPYQSRLVDNWNYQRFLQYGPRYATALDRLLGVSEPLTTAKHAFSGGQFEFTTK